MGVSERKQRQQEALRNRIISSSRDIVNQEGWAALSIRKIADAIEYSVPVIYKHFDSKEALTTYFVAEGFQTLKETIAAHMDAQASVEERLHQLAQGYWQFALKHPKDYELMFAVGLPTCEMHQKVPLIAELASFLREIIDELIAKSGKTEIEKCVKYRSLWGMLHGIVSIELLDLNKQDAVCPSLVLKDSINAFSQAILTN